MRESGGRQAHINEKSRGETDNRIGSCPIIPRGFYESWDVPISVGQSLSALGTSSLENFATIRGLHSLSEAMLLLSLTLLRLVGSEHFGYLLQDLLSGRFFCRSDRHRNSVKITARTTLTVILYPLFFDLSRVFEDFFQNCPFF